jgi:D-aminopeptidase
MRARDGGVCLGRLLPGPLNAITDVSGVRVGHCTIIEGEDVRTGVTVVAPREGLTRDDPVFAGCHRLNGNGEMTGLEWIREAGVLATPVGLTNTHSVGVVRDALIAAELEERRDHGIYWCMPVVAETFDGTLNDINGMHVRPKHVRAALADLRGGAVEEGSLGGGTGMICHELKGGIGTASRVLDERVGGWTVGALVQANYGSRPLLRVDGVPVGRALTAERIPSPFEQRDRLREAAGAGSIIVLLATDAPLLPHQCERLAQRATIGLARAGGGVEDSSGDLFLAFATGNRGLPPADYGRTCHDLVSVTMVRNETMTPLFEAAGEATEEAILNALLAAGTMTGKDGVTAYGLDPETLRDALAHARTS